MIRIRVFLILIAIFCLKNGEAQAPTDSIYNTTASLKRGCYVSVQEFLTNSPSVLDSFVVESVMRTQKNWEGTLSRTPYYAGKIKKVKHIWGFCDGEDTYVFHQKEFFKIVSSETGHHFFAYEIIDPSYAIAPSLYGGAIGGGIAISIVISNCKKQKVEYKIHPKTGCALHPNPKKNKPIPVEYVILYRPKKGEVKTPIEFLVNDTLKVEFIPNSYELLKLKEGTTSIKICQGSDFDLCEVFTLDEAEVDYFKATISAKTLEQEILRVSESEGGYFSFKAYKAQEKRKK